MTNNVFFMSSEKLSSFLRYLHICPDIYGYLRKWLDKKTKVNFKMYDVTNWNTTITLNLLPDISESKSN